VLLYAVVRAQWTRARQPEAVRSERT